VSVNAWYALSACSYPSLRVSADSNDQTTRDDWRSRSEVQRLACAVSDPQGVPPQG